MEKTWILHPVELLSRHAKLRPVPRERSQAFGTYGAGTPTTVARLPRSRLPYGNHSRTTKDAHALSGHRVIVLACRPD